MSALLRAFPLALGLLASVLNCGGQPVGLPPIFEPSNGRNEPPTSPLQNAIPSASSRVRSLIAIASHRMLAEAETFNAPVIARAESSPADPTDTDATLMDRYVVKSPPLHVTEMPSHDPPLLKFFKTGT